MVSVFIGMGLKKVKVYGLNRVLHLGLQGQIELIMNQPEVRLTVFVVLAI